MKKILKNILAAGIGLGIALILAELVLHIYNPFRSRVQGAEIRLPANVTYEFHDVKIPGLDKDIIHHKNSLGFRGPELPEGKNTIKIFCVGGSTTECFYLSDGEDWPALLMQKLKKSGKDIWVNNAGLDGHSTFGHQILLRDHLLKFKPDYVIFLTGCNDVAADGINGFEGYHLNYKKRFLEHFELFNLYLNWVRSRNAKKMGMGHKPVDLVHWPTADTSNWGSRVWSDKMDGRLKAYKARLDSLVAMCKTVGAVPVLVSQPTLLGPGTDALSKRYLGNLQFQDDCALVYRSRLHFYNKAQEEVAAANHLIWVDAESELAANSDNYYDFFHYTKNGAGAMASLIFEQLEHKIQKQK